MLYLSASFHLARARDATDSCQTDMMDWKRTSTRYYLRVLCCISSFLTSQTSQVAAGIFKNQVRALPPNRLPLQVVLIRHFALARFTTPHRRRPILAQAALPEPRFGLFSQLPNARLNEVLVRLARWNIHGRRFLRPIREAIPTYQHYSMG